MFKLKIISSSVRPGRKGPIVGKWVESSMQQLAGFEVEFIDLGELNLPMMDEPYHPRMQQYQHEHTKAWAAKIDEADAFVFVTAEYDYNYPAPLRNALEYLSKEWAYKPAGIVSYGGISAGTRAFVGLKGDLSSFRVVPLMESINIPFFDQFINESGEFVPNNATMKAMDALIAELPRWTKGMQLIRENRL